MQPPEPLLGQTISHYRIVEKQGRGGMRSVNKSEDTRLDRSILVVHALAPNAPAIITPDPRWLSGEPQHSLLAFNARVHRSKQVGAENP